MVQKLTGKQRMARLRKALGEGRNPTDKPLLQKLDACGVGWKDGRYRCRTPACMRCREANIRRQQRNTFDLLGHFRNDELALVSVVLGATSNINGLTPLIAKGRQDTKNCFVSARRRDERWHGTYLRAWHEIDAVGAEHMPILPPNRKALIPSLAPMAAETLLPTWLPTWHGLMFTNGLPLDEVKYQFRRQWKLDHQVDVRALIPENDVTTNLSNVTSYANKFHTTVSLDGRFSDPWPVTWETKFFGWIDSAQRNGFESLRMTVNQYIPSLVTEVSDPSEAILPMPFIHSFTGVPMHNNTGRWA